MARLKKKYSNGRPRTSSGDAVSSPPKDYSRNIRSHWGNSTDEVMDKLSEQIKRRKTIG